MIGRADPGQNPSAVRSSSSRVRGKASAGQWCGGCARAGLVAVMTARAPPIVGHDRRRCVVCQGQAAGQSLGNPNSVPRPSSRPPRKSGARPKCPEYRAGLRLVTESMVTCWAARTTTRPTGRSRTRCSSARRRPVPGRGRTAPSSATRSGSCGRGRRQAVHRHRHWAADRQQRARGGAGNRPVGPCRVRGRRPLQIWLCTRNEATGRARALAHRPVGK